MKFIESRLIQILNVVILFEEKSVVILLGENIFHRTIKLLLHRLLIFEEDRPTIDVKFFNNVFLSIQESGCLYFSFPLGMRFMCAEIERIFVNSNLIQVS